MENMEQPNEADFEQPTDDVLGQPVVIKPELGLGVLFAPWWVILLEGIAGGVGAVFRSLKMRT